MTSWSHHSSSDRRWLTVASAQADKIQGHTADNPAVGCAILSQDGQLVGVGHTSYAGRPHAEVNALAMAGEKAKGGTAYVTLEPCAHHGKTPPCARALIEAGISHVVYGCLDPDGRVSGKGVEMLEAHGVQVRYLAHQRAARQMAGFLSRHTTERPFVMVKMATSADGFIAESRDKQTWLTGPVSRAYTHDLRSRCDVMLTTSGTIAADNPSMTARIAGYGFDQMPLAILDSEARLPKNAACLNAMRPVILYHRKEAKLQDWPAHVEPVAVSQSQEGVAISEVLADLHKRAYGMVMVEAGAKLFETLDRAQVIDELVWLSAPIKINQGIFAWSCHDKMDFCAPEAYITSYRTRLGTDRLNVLHPIKG